MLCSCRDPSPDTSPVPSGITGEPFQRSPGVTIIFRAELHFLLCQVSNVFHNDPHSCLFFPRQTWPAGSLANPGKWCSLAPATPACAVDCLAHVCLTLVFRCFRLEEILAVEADGVWMSSPSPGSCLGEQSTPAETPALSGCHTALAAFGGAAGQGLQAAPQGLLGTSW